MQRVLSIFMALCISLTFALDAHAKRFGGGKSFGSAPSHQTRQAPQQTQAAPNQAGRQTPAAASGASRWLGPLAGLAAGGLLASAVPLPRRPPSPAAACHGRPCADAA